MGGGAAARPSHHSGILCARARDVAQLHNVEIAEEVLPGLTAYAGPGHTPGHSSTCSTAVSAT